MAKNGKIKAKLWRTPEGKNKKREKKREEKNEEKKREKKREKKTRNNSEQWRDLLTYFITCYSFLVFHE